MFKLLTSLSYLNDLLIKIIAVILPPIAVHNTGKYFALKKAFYLTTIDGVEGDYIEFGVFSGSSMSCALHCARTTRLGKLKETSQFFGFDSFEGFGDVSDKDRHLFFTDNNFAVNLVKVKKRLNRIKRKNQKLTLVKGFFSETLDGLTPTRYDIDFASVILIDCDTYSAATSCLRFSAPIIQEGTIIIIDDYANYRGNSNKGTYGAFQDFLKSFEEFQFRIIFHYGIGGIAYIAFS
jgi:hypothetical protein